MTATMREPGGAPVPGQPAGFDPVALARLLLRTARAGSLATLDAGTGAPFASLVGVATAMDGAPLMLLSRLSAHTTNLLADPRVSLLVGRAGRGDPLAHPRLTILGEAAPVEDEAARRRYLSRHPKAALYAGFGDFLMVRLTMQGGHLNGGFARAARLSGDELGTDCTGAGALAAGEQGALDHVNADHADAVALYATALLGRPAGRWRMSGLDPDGCDLMRGDEAARLPFPRRILDPAGLRAMLVELAAAARTA